MLRVCVCVRVCVFLKAVLIDRIIFRASVPDQISLRCQVCGQSDLVNALQGISGHLGSNEATRASEQS